MPTPFHDDQPEPVWVQTPSGALIQVQVPAGMAPGQLLTIQVPAAAPAPVQQVMMQPQPQPQSMLQVQGQVMGVQGQVAGVEQIPTAVAGDIHK